VQVNERVGLTFAGGLRTILRQDPDIVMVGEIRDPETAAISMQASMTGHLVLSTLHTNDAPSAVSRLIDMGVEPFLITSCSPWSSASAWPGCRARSARSRSRPT
jgi:type II secretory ATPase GspE/PulE/Tfp pilus assembly ATPase PilB-like protein